MARCGGATTTVSPVHHFKGFPLTISSSKKDTYEMARTLQSLSAMNENIASKQTLDGWLDAVKSHLDARRYELRARPRPKRNRERERARREARRLFAEYEADRVLARLM